MNLLEEACWAWDELKSGGRLSPDDSSVLAVSWNRLAARLDHLVEAFGHPRARHCVAIKTQPHPGVLARLAEWGYGLEAASFEEVQLAEDARAPYIVFDSPVKRRDEIEACQSVGVPMLLNANCLEELERIPPDPAFTVGIRVNPQVRSDAPDIFHVSGDESKFGVPLAHRDDILAAITRYPVEALHVHSGSSMKDMATAVTAVRLIVDLATEANDLLAREGADRRIRILDIGGGMAPESTLDRGSAMWRYAAALREQVPELWSDFGLVTEFGQWTHFHSGYAYSEVEYAVNRGDTRVAFLHLGADFLVRDVYTKPRDIEFHLIPRDGEERETCRHDLAGPLCFAGDYVARGIQLPRLEAGDVVILLNTGANAFGLWSRHCSRTVPRTIGVNHAERRLEIMSDRTRPFA